MPFTPSDRTRQALLDILDNAELACSFVVGMTWQEFVSDRRTFYAATRCLEIISEASRRLDDATRERHPPSAVARDHGVGQCLSA
ncbi:DUF86 domain-containing protein [Telmatospirillum siberiense]|uniref:HepT-like ribonuclease domain-containing protein n=1 Tax=Telmatospirillum siberiense TaxID=382514 RepID=UPI003B83519E